jgi:hypothetical protein
MISSAKRSMPNGLNFTPALKRKQPETIHEVCGNVVSLAPFSLAPWNLSIALTFDLTRQTLPCGSRVYLIG